MDEQPDPPSLRLSPLTAALLIPALCAAVLASLWLASHTKSTDRPTATTSPNALPSPPGPSPWPVVWPPEDGGTVDAQTAYGVLDIVPPSTAPPRYTASLAANATVPPPERPDPRRETVQRIRPLDQATVTGIARRLGDFSEPTVHDGLLTWPGSGIVFDPATSTITTAGLDARQSALPSTPHDTASATGAADSWLVQRGLAEPIAPLGVVQLSRGDLAAFPTWEVVVPHLAGQSDATEITMTVSGGSGLLSRLTIVHPIVAGAAPYPVVDWEKAWAQVQTGRARDVEDPGGGSDLLLTIDHVALTARIVQTRAGGAYVIPSWAFTDSASRTTLYWPALDPAWYTLG